MSILVRPLLVLLTFIVIVVVVVMLLLSGGGDGRDGSADDSPAKGEKAEKAEKADAPEAPEKTDEPDAPEKKAEPRKEHAIAAADLEVGDCISDARSTLGDVTTFEEAKCDEPHDGEVFTLIELPGVKGVKYPGTKFVTGKGQRGCRARLRRQATATAFRDKQLGYKFVYPTRLSWIDDDREITCLATFKKPRSEKLAQR